MFDFEYLGGSRIKNNGLRTKNNEFRRSLTFPLALKIMKMRTFRFSDIEDLYCVCVFSGKKGPAMQPGHHTEGLETLICHFCMFLKDFGVAMTYLGLF